jgi:type II secretory ATPase GspE/PulE/Tfp pilus assembly ATPase PilB-like protein
MASSMNAVVGQRVVRQICTHCKEEYDAPEAVEKQIKDTLGKLMPPKIKLYRGKGCNQCGDTGYEGRVGIFEVLQVNEKIGRLILERSASGDIEKAAIENGMVTMVQDGFLKALDGLTTVEEVLRVAME